MSRAFFDDLGDALVSFLPPDLRDFEGYRTSHNIKIWFGPERKEHYEAQIIRRRGKRRDLEIGFHTEHGDPARNDEVVSGLTDEEQRWRNALGDEPEAGTFLGNTSWRRLSEIWEDAGTGDPDTAIEAAERLATYIRALQPLR